MFTSAVIPREIEGVKVERIGVCAFSGHENLKTVVIPNTVVYIGNSAFARTGIKTIDIPNSISEIPQLAFSECRDLAVVRIGSGTEKIDTSPAFFRGRNVHIVMIYYNKVRFMGQLL